ncbi:MAG: hypothetical protein V1846_01945 [Candidatus Komeilibacteria bacterium]
MSNLTVLLLLLSLLLTALRQPGYRQIVVLHYNAYFGIDLVGSWAWLWVYVALAISAGIVNFLFSFYVFTKDKYMSYYLNLASVFIAAVTLVYLIALGPYL